MGAPRTCAALPIGCILEREGWAVKRMYVGKGSNRGDGHPRRTATFVEMFGFFYFLAPEVRDMWSNHNTDEMVLASRIVPPTAMRTAVGNGTMRL
jgi:hypothetical protein